MAEYVEQNAIESKTAQTSPVPSQCIRISFPPLDPIQSNPKKNNPIPPEKTIRDLRMLPKKCTSNNQWSGKSSKPPNATPNHSHATKSKSPLFIHRGRTSWSNFPNRKKTRYRRRKKSMQNRIAGAVARNKLKASQSLDMKFVIGSGVYTNVYLFLRSWKNKGDIGLIVIMRLPLNKRQKRLKLRPAVREPQWCRREATNERQDMPWRRN